MSEKKTDFAKYKVRRCRWLNHCEVCKLPITDGQLYHDGGLDRRAHVSCVDSERAAKERG